MTFLKTLTLLCAALTLAACTNPNRFGEDAMGGMNGGMGAGMGAGSMDGSASDPRSPAYFQQTVGDRVLFIIDTYTLTPEGQNTLRGQAQWLQANRDYNAVIEGHADEQGTREYNLALGARRANSVQEYLIGQGVPASRLRTVSYGKERPIEICSNEACYAQNRRAVTVISVGAGS
ncbi:MAG: peptidoglycan-associated lipoprotein Pal [Rhodobacterales bacterium]|nr:peptidoglycan-associated lipoprotein Pal [Rhodobacterales bacterium]